MTLPKISVPLAVSFALVAGIIGFGSGYALTAEYHFSDTRVMDLGRPDRLLDLRYINAMIAHHRGAMLLAEQAQASERPEVRALAKDIGTNEPKLINELYQWKQEWYGDTRRVTDPVVANLGEYNATFDLRFLNALIAHHEAGIAMTREVRVKSSRAAVLDNADAVEAFLKNGLGGLGEWRQHWYQL